jgi:hypothetical protein
MARLRIAADAFADAWHSVEARAAIFIRLCLRSIESVVCEV